MKKYQLKMKNLAFNLKIVSFYRITAIKKPKKIVDLRIANNCFNNVYVNSVFSMTLLWSTPVLVSVVSIGAYQYFVDQLKIEDIFSCIGIFNSIQEPIRSLPAAINSLIECLISLKRIEV